jgi:hypothetical protein
MAEIRQATIKVRDRQVSGGSIPGDAVFGEPFVNLYNGVLRFSGVTGGDFETSSQTGVFEVGSSLYNQKITNRLNINDNFIISGGTGLISTYGGASGAGLSGKFLSGTTSGFVLGNISDIQGVTTRVQPGTNITTGGTDNFPTVNLVASPSVNNLTFSGAAIGGNVQAAAGTFTSLSATTLSGGTILSGGTNLYNIFQKIGDDTAHTQVQPGTNITTGGTSSLPTINLVASPSVNNITFSGSAIGGNVQAAAGTFTSFSATTLSGGTILSGGTNLYSIFAPFGTISGVETIGQGTNIATGGTAVNPTISLVASPSVNNITFSGSAIGGNVQAAAGTFTSLSATTLSGGTILSGSTNLYSIFQKIGDVDGVANVNAGTNITTGGTATSPIINVANSPVFTGLVSATGFTDSSLTAGRVVYVGASGRLVDEAGFEYDAAANLLKAGTIQVGTPGTTGTTATIYGDVLVIGQAISGFTSELYIEDNLIELNYNPTASTASTSLGAGWSIQDGSGSAGTDVLWDIRGAATGLANRSFSTNLFDLRIRETGTVSAPNGLRVIAETDVIDGGSY